MTFAIKAKVTDLLAETFAFSAQKTMYGGKRVAKGDAIFVFASENEGGPGLIASGIVRRTALAKRRLGRGELKLFFDWNDGRPETELNFKFYSQATNKLAGIS